MLQGEHSAILSTFIKLPFAIKILVLSIFEWPLKTGFSICANASNKCQCSWIEHDYRFNFWSEWSSTSILVYKRRDGSGETVRMCRIVRAFAAGPCDKYQNLVCWPIILYIISGNHL